MSKTKQTIRERLSACMSEIGYLEKDGKNSGQGYRYLSEQKVKEVCQKAFVRQGLVPEWTVSLPYLSSRTVYTRKGEKEGLECVCHVRLTVRDLSGDTATAVVTDGVGQKIDVGDKAVMGAQTAALRECLKSLMLIPSGDDPEADVTTDEHAKVDTNGAAPKRQRQSKEAEYAELSKKLKTKILNTKRDALDDLKAELVTATEGWPDKFRNPLRDEYQKHVTACMANGD